MTNKTPSSPPLSFGIAGFGLLGRLLAWQLLRRGHRVSIFESDDLSLASTPKAAAFTAAGMVSPLSELADSEPLIYRMGLHALALWPQWLEGLSHSEVSDFFQYQGSLAIAHPQDQTELEHFQKELDRHLGAMAISHSNEQHYRPLNSAELAKTEANLSRQFNRALFLPDEGHIHNRQLMTKLLSEVTALGGQIIDKTAVHIDHETITEQASGTQHCFDQLIDCRGIGAKSDLHQPLRGVRGEVLYVETTEVSLQRPIRLMHPRYQLYIVPKPNNQFVIGATSIESEDTSPISLQSNLELASALYSIHPAFAEARIVDTPVNLRPAFMDNRPYLEESNGLIRANGLYRHGYLLAPILAEAILSRFDPQMNSPFETDITHKLDTQNATILREA